MNQLHTQTEKLTCAAVLTLNQQPKSALFQWFCCFITLLGSGFPIVQQLGATKPTEPVDSSVLLALKVQWLVFSCGYSQWCKEVRSHSTPESG